MKKFFVWMMLVVSVMAAVAASTGVRADSDDFSVPATSAIAVDAASGKILYSQNADQAGLGIASITKLLTAYLVYKEIGAGKLSWDTRVKLSSYAYQLTNSTQASNIRLSADEDYSVRDLMNAMLLPSANSAAIALAERVAGSEPKFVDLMRAQLKDWGVTDAVIVNASGLSNDVLDGHIYPGSSEDAQNTMSARDVAILAMHLVRDYPQVLEITGETTTTFDKGGASQQTLQTTNQLLPGFQTSRSGADGLKTGTTGATGGNVDAFCASTTQNGLHVITVVLGDKGAASSPIQTFIDTNALITEVMGKWQAYGLAIKGQALSDKKSIYIPNANTQTTKLVSKSDFYVAIPRGNTPNFSIKYAQLNPGIQAPVSRHTTVIRASVAYHDKLGYLPGFSGAMADLTPAKSVERANPFVVLWNSFVSFVNEEL